MFLRMTPQRRAVLEAVASCGGHPTAAQIYTRVRVTQPGIAYATVYNALRALVEHRAVLQLKFGDTASRYDPRPERHDHALCLGCQSLVDVAPSRPSRRALRSAAAKGFQLNGQHTQFFGLCADCATRPDAGEKD
jgi:Fe2+ or Zn2+ uptake regulation protein